MELKKKILLDAEQILKKSEVLKELNDSDMNHLKGGCVVWLFDGGGSKPTPIPCTGCATSCQNSSTWGS